MPKGVTNNPNGRPKGVPNKTTKELKQFITNLFSDNMETIQSDIDKLEPKERLDFYAKLLPYIVARRAPENDQGQTMPTVNIQFANGLDGEKLLGE